MELKLEPLDQRSARSKPRQQQSCQCYSHHDETITSTTATDTAATRATSATATTGTTTRVVAVVVGDGGIDSGATTPLSPATITASWTWAEGYTQQR